MLAGSFCIRLGGVRSCILPLRIGRGGCTKLWFERHVAKGVSGRPASVTGSEEHTEDSSARAVPVHKSVRTESAILSLSRTDNSGQKNVSAVVQLSMAFHMSSSFAVKLLSCHVGVRRRQGEEKGREHTQTYIMTRTWHGHKATCSDNLLTLLLSRDCCTCGGSGVAEIRIPFTSLV